MSMLLALALSIGVLIAVWTYVALGPASLPVWAGWPDQIGAGDPCFEKTGVLWLAGHADADRLRNNVTMHRAIGAKAHAVSPVEINHIDPTLDSTGVAVAGGSGSPPA